MRRRAKVTMHSNIDAAIHEASTRKWKQPVAFFMGDEAELDYRFVDEMIARDFVKRLGTSAQIILSGPIGRRPAEIVIQRH